MVQADPNWTTGAETGDSSGLIQSKKGSPAVIGSVVNAYNAILEDMNFIEASQTSRGRTSYKIDHLSDDSRWTQIDGKTVLQEDLHSFTYIDSGSFMTRTHNA